MVEKENSFPFNDGIPINEQKEEKSEIFESLPTIESIDGINGTHCSIVPLSFFGNHSSIMELNRHKESAKKHNKWNSSHVNEEKENLALSTFVKMLSSNPTHKLSLISIQEEVGLQENEANFLFTFQKETNEICTQKNEKIDPSLFCYLFCDSQAKPKDSKSRAKFLSQVALPQKRISNKKSVKTISESHSKQKNSNWSKQSPIFLHKPKTPYKNAQKNENIKREESLYKEKQNSLQKTAHLLNISGGRGLDTNTAKPKPKPKCWKDESHSGLIKKDELNICENRSCLSKKEGKDYNNINMRDSSCRSNLHKIQRRKAIIYKYKHASNIPNKSQYIDFTHIINPPPKPTSSSSSFFLYQNKGIQILLFFFVFRYSFLDFSNFRTFGNSQKCSFIQQSSVNCDNSLQIVSLCNLLLFF